jgi:hypothetical protein
MIRSQKFLLPVGAILVLGAFILAAPRTVHAVAAALVEITNTSSNPAVTQEIGQTASQMVYISCFGQTTPLSSGLTCYQYVAGGLQGQQLIPNYTVPSDRYLVITAADVNSFANSGGPCPKGVNISVGSQIANNVDFRQGWTVAANAGTTHFTYPPGYAFAPGTTILMANGSTACSAEVDLYGYLTAN